MIILDTNVLSELMRPAPAERVLHWIAIQESALLYTTSVTQAEILHGVRALPAGRKRKTLEQAVATMFEEDFAQRVLPFASEAARAYAVIVTERSRLGRPISQFDAQIAAITQVNNARLATRNGRDFERCEISLCDPWTEP